MMSFLFIVGSLIILSSAESSKEAEKILRPYLDAFMEAVNTKNYDKVAEYYHPDAVSVETDKVVYYKPDKIIEAMKKYYEQNPLAVRSKMESEEFSGGDKVLSYNSKWSMPDTNATFKGPYFMIWVLNSDGKWKIYHDEYSITEIIPIKA